MDKFATGIYMDKLQYKLYHENKTHTPDDFPYNTYLCSIPLDFQSVNLHWHDEVEIIVIKKGIGIVSVDLTTYSVSAGDIIFVLPGQLHSISQKDNEIMEYENILVQTSHRYGREHSREELLEEVARVADVVEEENPAHRAGTDGRAQAAEVQAHRRADKEYAQNHGSYHTQGLEHISPNKSLHSPSESVKPYHEHRDKNVQSERHPQRVEYEQLEH